MDIDRTVSEFSPCPSPSPISLRRRRRRGSPAVAVLRFYSQQVGLAKANSRVEVRLLLFFPDKAEHQRLAADPYSCDRLKGEDVKKYFCLERVKT